MFGAGTLSFSLSEVVALLGLTQSIYVLVFMSLRSGRLSRALIPSLFFTVLAAVFFLGLAESRWASLFASYEVVKWFLWALLFPLSALLILQIAKVTKPPTVKLWAGFTLIPIAYVFSSLLAQSYGEFEKWLYLGAVIIGGISLLVIWSERQFLDELHRRKNGKERYWLIISLIVLNIGLLAINFVFVNNTEWADNFEMIRHVIGISFIYLASTSLFRIYPQAVSIAPQKNEEKEGYLTDSDVEIAMKIENLFHLEKVYQETSYKRSDLARECDVTEAHLSKIVNIYFEKSVPQLLNTYRVEDAKHLLKETEADVIIISEESGFNSIATFNRVFKEIVGISPTEYRKL